MAPNNFVVTVKETGGGKPYLLLEPDEDIGLDDWAHITMQLPEGADIHEAERVASLLNENIVSFRVKRY